MTDQTLPFPAFQATRKEADLGKELNADFGHEGPHTGLIYDGHCYIEFNTPDSPVPGKYFLNIGRDEWIDDDLATLEKILWSMHYMGEFAPSDMLIGGESLAHYIEGTLLAFGCTAFDTAQIIRDHFADKDAWTLEEAADILNGIRGV